MNGCGIALKYLFSSGRMGICQWDASGEKKVAEGIKKSSFHKNDDFFNIHGMALGLIMN